jgi:enterochelin esterase-like enzyme
VVLSVRSDDHPVPGPYKADVYLPPDYAASQEACPVFYVFDGSDLSPEHDGLLGEGQIRPAIFVAIQNKNGRSRFYDLTPAAPGRPSAGGLDGMRRLITERIKPYVDGHFRTLPDATHTGVIGHSLAGLASCWLGYHYPETFGLAACLEPSLWWNDRELLKALQHDPSAKTGTRFWIMAAEQEYPGMWRDAKRAAVALQRRGWREGEDLAFYQVHNGSHGWDSCKTQLRDMLGFLLRKSAPRLIDVGLTNCQGPQYEPIRLKVAGEFANPYLDLRFTDGFRATAIAPTLKVSDPAVVTIGDLDTAQLLPVGEGWTTVAADYQGRQACLAVQGFRLGGYDRIRLRPTSGRITVDGGLTDWRELDFEKTDGDGRSAGFRFGVTFDANFVYVGVRLRDETWTPKPSLADPLNQDGVEILLDGRPDPMRSLGRGKERYFDFMTLQMAPGEGPDSTKLRRTKDGESAIPSGLVAACVRTPEGFNAEVAIPASTIDKAQGGAWREFRLNLCQYDLDDPNGPVRRILWQPDWEGSDNVIASGTFSRATDK